MIRDFLVSKITRERLDSFIAKYASNALTLDIGCANSPYSRYFPNRVGFDIKEGEGVHIVGDAHLMPFESESFEQILCTEVLEHLHSPEKAVAEMYRVLKKGGVLILTTRFLFPIHDAPGDYFRFTKYGLRHLFREWKIEVLKEEVSTMETLAVLIQRVSFQTDTYGGRFTKAVILLLARCLLLLRFFIKREYGIRNKTYTQEEENIMTSGYYLIARK